MDKIIVETKLAPSRVRNSLVNRDKLLDRLHLGRRKQLIIVTGPGGYGKTTLATLWRRELIAQEHDVGWFGITPDDNDLRQFVVYFAAAIDKAAENIGREAITLFNRDSSDATGLFIAALVNDIQNYRRDIYLVLDDYHHVKAPAVHQMLEQLLAMMPANFHLVLISRTNPPLSLERLRAHDQVTEINFADLRLSFEEASAFFELQGLDIDAKDRRVFYESTDGWVTGLQLFCIGLKKNPDITQHIGNHYNQATRFTQYLDAEVLSVLSADVVDFMIKISSCQKFNAELAAHLTGSSTSAAMLRQLEDENIFLLPLDTDDGLQWYRFHPLMRAALSERLSQLPVAEFKAMNQRACQWLLEHELASEAVLHALYAQELKLAADLIGRCGRPLAAQAQFKTLLSWSEQIPEAIAKTHVAMQLPIIWALVMCGRVDEARARIQHIANAGLALNNNNRFELKLLEATVSFSEDDTRGILEILNDIEGVDDDPFLIQVVANLRSVAYCYSGEYAKARDVQLAIRTAGNQAMRLTRRLAGECFVGLSFALQGDMVQADRSYRKALSAAEQQVGYYSEPACFAAGYLAEVLYETGRWSEGRQFLIERLDIIDHTAPIEGLIRSYVALARIARYSGHINEAKSYLETLEDMGLSKGVDRMVATALYEGVLVALQEGNASRVEELLRRLDILADTYAEMDYCAFAEIPVLAQLARLRNLFYRGRLEAVLDAIERLNTRLLPWRRFKVLASLKLLAAMALDKLGKKDETLDKVADCLFDCQRLGLQRTVLDEGPRAIELVRELARRKNLDPVLNSYIEKLLWDIEQQSVDEEIRCEVVNDRLIEPLSKREMEILQLLAQAPTNKKLGLLLGISLETVKWHLKNIYGKLSVISRDEAVARARDLSLIE